MSIVVAGSSKRKGGFWRTQTFNPMTVNNRVWVRSRHGSDLAANGGLASLLKISCPSAIDPIADNLCSANNTGVKDRALRSFSLWTAGLAGVVALIGFAVQQIEPLVIASTLFLAGLATLLFFRMLLSRFYREGVDLANRAMQGNEARPGGSVKFKDPEWGLFGQRTGNLPLLWVRAILVLGVLPAYVLQHMIGGQAGWLWFSAAFVVMELSVMHAAIDAKGRKV